MPPIAWYTSRSDSTSPMVVPLDRGQRGPKDFVALRDAVLSRQHTPTKEAANEGRHHDRHNRHRHPSVAWHLGIVADKPLLRNEFPASVRPEWLDHTVRRFYNAISYLWAFGVRLSYPKVTVGSGTVGASAACDAVSFHSRVGARSLQPGNEQRKRQGV